MERTADGTDWWGEKLELVWRQNILNIFLFCLGDFFWCAWVILE
jgi:hypothetical protein